MGGGVHFTPVREAARVCRNSTISETIQCRHLNHNELVARVGGRGAAVATTPGNLLAPYGV